MPGRYSTAYPSARLHCLVHLRRVDATAGNYHDGHTRRFERIDVLPLRRQPSLDESLQDRIPDFGLAQGATRDSGVQCGEMMTVEMPTKSEALNQMELLTFRIGTGHRSRNCVTD
jgi:hypothetical protein